MPLQVCALAIVGFGAAPSYGMAVLMRCLPGLLNGITGALKTIIGESFDGDGQARALSALSCAWGIGETDLVSFPCIRCELHGESDETGIGRRCQCSTSGWCCAGTVVGSLLGGSLADPCRELGTSMPFCGPGQLLDRQPFLLPCAAVGALSSFAAVIR